ncbi:hypothetical protein CIK05_00335 [Bdellovibrio sp. qaytius]|nr:hypothetical protein CIK05_00335 [Bdellovibrio sp. qaytius]
MKMNFKKIIKYFILIIMFPVITQAATECVQIFYDRGPQDYWIGHANAVFMQNLLGHFPHLQQVVEPIENYKKGDIERCKASVYIGTHFMSVIPEDFHTDYINTKKNVAWLGYNIWRNPEVLQKVFNYRYDKLTTLDTTRLDQSAKPTYFKWIYYKGERFKKFGEWSQTNPRTFNAPFEMSAISPLDMVNSETQILSVAEHNGTGERLPYIIRNKNHFYVADSVFSYMHESDRYLIFSDVIFDILGEKPRHTKKFAVMRIEDVHPLINDDVLKLISSTLKKLEIPINISIIPFYYDPLQYDDRPAKEEFMPASQRPNFVEWIKDLQANNATFIWHGVTHQYSKIKNPFTGASGDDFEFWNARTNKPIAEDNAKYIVDRLFIGFKELTKVKIKPYIWITPHYQASAVDNIMFSYLVPWSMGRMIYQNFDLKSSLPDHTKNMWYTDVDPAKQKARQSYLGGVQLQTNSPWSGQLFPYEIFGDVYGQRILPENLGNVQPKLNDQVSFPRTADEIIADAKRNLVLRDVWASYFYHPFLFQIPEPPTAKDWADYDGDTREMERVVLELKKMGYEFINIEEFARQNVDVLRPEPKVNWGTSLH